VYITVRGSDAMSCLVLTTLLVLCLGGIHADNLVTIPQALLLQWPRAPPNPFAGAAFDTNRDATRCKHRCVAYMETPGGCPAGTEEWCAWCVFKCDMTTFGAVLHLEQKLLFVLTVNRWIRSRVLAINAQLKQSCVWKQERMTQVTVNGETDPGVGSFTDTVLPLAAGEFLADTTSSVPVATLSTCPSTCKSFPSQPTAVSAADDGCRVVDGQISITPVQTFQSRIAYYGPGNGWEQFVFKLDDWEKEDTDLACHECLANSDGCITPSYTQLQWPETTSMQDLRNQHQSASCVSANLVDAFSLSQVRGHCKWWLESEYGLNNVQQVATPCDRGVSSSCLENKGAVTGRACDFHNVCLNKARVFGDGYATPSSGEMHILLRGGTIPFQLTWYSDHGCSVHASSVDVNRENFRQSFSLFNNRNSFKIHIAATCWECDPHLGELTHDIGSGRVTCGLCSATQVQEDESRASCAGPVTVQMCKDCLVDHVPYSADRSSQTKTCRECSSIRNPEVGSHRPVSVTHCKNCTLSQTWSLQYKECGELASMTVEPHDSGYGLSGVKDQYKQSEYEAAHVTDGWYRDTQYKQIRCRCTNDHKYTQFCGHYAVRDQDAWMKHNTAGSESKLSTLSLSANAATDYSIMREGRCRPCHQCSVGEYNGKCKEGKEGTCSSCLTLDQCTQTQYLKHDNPNGCMQTRALSDYVCTECNMWDIIDGGFMLLVGCGVRNLKRWAPSGDRDGKDQLLTVDCMFDNTDDAEFGDPCEYKGATLVRQIPFGSFSSVIPYCAPGWFVDPALARQSKTQPYDPNYCRQCLSCRSDQRKKPQWRPCPGSTDTDTQGEQCTDRCENNMYEQNNTCLYCKTCKEGEIGASPGLAGS